MVGYRSAGERGQLGELRCIVERRERRGWFGAMVGRKRVGYRDVERQQLSTDHTSPLAVGTRYGDRASKKLNIIRHVLANNRLVTGPVLQKWTRGVSSPDLGRGQIWDFLIFFYKQARLSRRRGRSYYGSFL